MDVTDVTEADEAPTARHALAAFTEIYRRYRHGEESSSVMEMYEQAALKMGVSTRTLTMATNRIADELSKEHSDAADH